VPRRVYQAGGPQWGGCIVSRMRRAPRDGGATSGCAGTRTGSGACTYAMRTATHLAQSWPPRTAVPPSGRSMMMILVLPHRMPLLSCYLPCAAFVIQKLHSHVQPCIYVGVRRVV